MQLDSKYNPKDTEHKWLTFWHKHQVSHANVQSKKKPFTIVIPPPNVTGILHMGHALNNTLQDILIRYHRMNDREVLWMAGTDHAGIATQNVVEKQIAKEGKRRQDFTRDEFLTKLWAWKKEYGDTIIHQLEKLGSSCDWQRQRFTMDDEYSYAVKDVFIRLFRKGLIYQGKYIINWCPRCQTALADEEAEHKERNGKIYHLRYVIKGAIDQHVVVATTRPETMLGDTAVAVNPSDERYTKLIGKTVILPIVNREIPIIADDYVSKEFGSGAVKVTPAHDPNDFAMGLRHHLPMINVMYPDARINEHGGKYHGLDRFEARKQLLADLEASGDLVKVEDHKNAVGHCYRCDTVVEPYLSKQWFVKMKPLAEPALKAVKDGSLVIRPERFEKVYINWMEGIRDWCISRQIWWGHRIPVWYDNEGNVFVAYDENEAKALARQKHGKDVPIKQDEDVLDTWFSSWLWPFATLGWPKETPELKYFYPTNTLFTASEIIFFWVARMVMAGYEFMGQSPFSEVYIHGTVRDSKGRKMSKSLGNAIDPLEIIEEYGADALRFSLIINSGQDIYISKEKFEIGRNFANKIWNASRLVLMNCQNHLHVDEGVLVLKDLDTPSRWILGRLEETVVQVSKSIETFRYSEAETTLQDFFWGDFCDWYLEWIKAKFNETAVCHTALFVLKQSLKLMHPFMPFVTEEIYSHFKTNDLCLTKVKWPYISPDLIDREAQSEMQNIIDVIKSIRTVRTQWNIKPTQPLDVKMMVDNAKWQSTLEMNASDIKRLCKINEMSVTSQAINMKDAATVLVGTTKIMIPLLGLVDIDAEKKRMLAEKEQKQKAVDALVARLSSDQFVSKAPVDVITKEKERLELLQKQVTELEGVLATISL